MSSVHIVDDNEHLVEKLSIQFGEIVGELVKTKLVISIGLSGGSLIDLLVLILPRLQLPWARIRFFFVDERFVPFTSEDSTFAAYQAKLFRQLPLTEKNLIKIDPTLASVQLCAQDYQKKLREQCFQDDDQVQNTTSDFSHSSFSRCS